MLHEPIIPSVVRIHEAITLLLKYFAVALNLDCSIHKFNQLPFVFFIDFPNGILLYLLDRLLF